MIRPLLAPTLILLATTFSAGADPAVPVGRFSQGSLDGWEARSFNGETGYALAADPELNRQVLRARANASASGRFRKIEVDLAKTPYLNWSWKVANIYPGIDELKKSGDDFPARIYVADERGLFGLTSIALNYVWASSHGVGEAWTSPYTSQVRLLAVDAGTAKLGSWITHKQDVRADLKRIFGEDVTRIDGVALMTDSDDHHGQAEAAYGDIWFSAE